MMEIALRIPHAGRHSVPGSRHLILILVVLLSVASGAPDAAGSSHAPNTSPVALGREDYAPFLLRPWQPGRDSVYLVMDPNCRYCLKALDRLDRLQAFNTYLLWAPILGPASVARVADFFRCDSPVGDTVLMAMQQRTSPQCMGEHHELRRLNDAAVDLLKISAVPGYFLGGRRVAPATLYRQAMRSAGDQDLLQGGGGFGAGRPRLAAVDWQRYRDFRIATPAESRPVAALVLDPAADDTDRILERIASDRRFDWYVFWSAGTGMQTLSERIPCNSAVSRQNARGSSSPVPCEIRDEMLIERNAEFQLLMGVNSVPAAFLDARPVALDSLIN